MQIRLPTAITRNCDLFERQPYKGTAENRRYDKDFLVDITQMTKEQVGKLRTEIEKFQAKNPKTYHIKSALRDIGLWFEYQDRPDKEGTVKHISLGVALLRNFIAKTESKWLYYRDKNGWLDAYYVDHITYTPPAKEKVGKNWVYYEPYITVRMAYTSQGVICHKHITIYSVVGYTAREILYRAGYLIETPNLRAEYDANFAKYDAAATNIGKQYLASGTTQQESGSDYWSKRWETVNFTIDGMPSKVVVDTLVEEGKSQSSSSRNSRGADNSFWLDAIEEIPEDADEDEDESSSSRKKVVRKRKTQETIKKKTPPKPEEDDDEEEELKPETVDLPDAMWVRVFHLKWHKQFDVHISNLEEYVYDKNARENIVLPPHHSALIESLLVSKENINFSDVVAGKQGGVIMMLQGPPGCLHADTPIHDPVDGSTLTVQEREQRGDKFHVYAKDKNGDIVIATAEAPWRYEEAEMVKLDFDNGQSITVTLDHLFWNGLSYVSFRQISQSLHGYGAVRLPSSLEPGQQARLQDDQRFPQTTPGYQDHCLNDYDLYDERLLLAKGIAQASLPLPNDALRHNRGSWHKGGLVVSDIHNHHKSSAHHSKTHYTPRSETLIVNGGEQTPHQEPCECVAGLFVAHGQSSLLVCQQGSSQLPHDIVLRSKEPSVAYNTFSSGWARITNATPVGKHVYYDFCVPEHHNYWACGLIHHNTGKTLTAEVYAEALERPMYTVQCSELGLSPDTLEKSLGTCLGRALRWKAIMLLDEADVYIHERGNNLQHNAIVGVFLRMLEYYNGILFFTTNRGDNIDDAVSSRCTARIDYSNPGVEERRRIWEVLCKANKVTIPPGELTKICSGKASSGRDIKNLLKLAILVSRATKQPLTAKLIEQMREFKPA